MSPNGINIAFVVMMLASFFAVFIITVLSTGNKE